MIFSAVLVLLCFATIERNFEWEDEVTLWEAVIEDSPLKWRGHFRVGLGLYLEKKSYDKAAVKFRDALVLKPDAHSIHNNIGLTYQRMGLFDEAEAEYRLAMEKEPWSVSPYLNLGTLHLRSGEHVRALEWFHLAIERDPDNVAAFVNAGFIYGDLGDYRRAVEMHTMALEINPHNHLSHYGLGLAYEGTNEFERAALHWREYLRLAPAGDAWRGDAGRHLERLEGRGFK